jgi:thiamine transporter ThiT
LLFLTSPVLISLLFSVIAYFLSNFRPTASAFFTWVMWLFLDLLAGESLVVLMASLFPNFVVALALTAFANGLWMSVGGFLVSPTILNPFWRYVFHYIDYVRFLPIFIPSTHVNPSLASFIRS